MSPSQSETIKLGRVANQDAVSDGLIGRPVGQQIEQDCIVRLGVGFRGRVWPVGSPHKPFRRKLHVGFSECTPVRIRRGTDLAQDVGACELYPRTSPFDQIGDDTESRMLGPLWFGQVPHVIKDDWGRKTTQNVFPFQDAVALGYELNMPTEIGDLPSHRLHIVHGAPAWETRAEPDAAQTLVVEPL